MQVVAEFLDYLENFSGLSYNTLRLYKRDLIDFSNFVRANLGEDFKITGLNADNLEYFSKFVTDLGSKVSTLRYGGDVNKNLSRNIYDIQREV
jgi:site-specific recombinase XerD